MFLVILLNFKHFKPKMEKQLEHI